MNTSVHTFALNRVESLLLVMFNKSFIEMYLKKYLEMYLKIIRII